MVIEGLNSVAKSRAGGQRIVDCGVGVLVVGVSVVVGNVVTLVVRGQIDLLKCMGWRIGWCGRAE